MKTLFRALVLSCLIVLLPVSASNHRKFLPIVYEQAVQIQSDGFGVCSGSVIEEDLILTAAHCITDGKMAVKFFDGRIENAKVVVKGSANGPDDWAYLAAETKDITPLKLKRELENLPLNTAYIAFNPTEDMIGVLPIRLYEIIPEAGKFIMHFQGAPIPGDSGSAIINRSGEVIGVVIAYYMWTDIGVASSAFFFTPTQSQVLPQSP